MLRVGNTMEVVVSALDPITQLTHVIFSIPWSDVKCIMCVDTCGNPLIYRISYVYYAFTGIPISINQGTPAQCDYITFYTNLYQSYTITKINYTTVAIVSTSFQGIGNGFVRRKNRL